MKEFTSEETKETAGIIGESSATLIHSGEVELLTSVRYEKTVSIGEKYVTETFEGSVDDVLKVAKGLINDGATSKLRDMTVNVDFSGLSQDVEQVSKAIEKVFENLNKTNISSC